MHEHHISEGKQMWQKIKCLFLVVAPLIAVAIAIVLTWNSYVSTTDIVLLGVFYFFSTLGITVGYHRMLTHEGFKAPEWLRGFFLVCGSMAWEGHPLDWASTHVKHHAHSDEEDDPHSPIKGFWHAHVGWIFDARNFPPAEVYAPHLLKDDTVLWANRTTPLWMTLALVIPFLFGGWTGLVWGGFVRIFLSTHITWSVNSVCHMFGQRDFQTTDESRNEWVVGLLAFGEGWHNNHHAFPRNAFHGMKWWQFDLSGLVIRFLETVGLAWNVERVADEVAEAQQIRMKGSLGTLAILHGQVMDAVIRADTELKAAFEPLLSRSLESLDPKDIADVQELYNSAVKRLKDIEQQMRRTSYMKKQRLNRYLEEVTQLMQQTKATANEYVRMYSLQS